MLVAQTGDLRPEADSSPSSALGARATKPDSYHSSALGAAATKPDSYHSYGPPLNGIRLPSPPALSLQLNGLHIPSYQKAASTTKQIPYHLCSQTEVNSSAFSTAEAQAWDQEAKRIHYHS